MDSYTRQIFEQAINQVDNNIVVGQRELLRKIMVAYIAGGHVLLEGPPGTAKTLSSKVLAHMLGRKFKRIQFTSDLLPQDILGSFVFTGKETELKFLPGPIFGDVIVADEINRAPPRTQSALLEAMEERQITVEGKAFPLHDDFFVVATQNPGDFEGTFPLPEVQLDRFLLKLRVDNLATDFEFRVLRMGLDGQLPPNLSHISPLNFDMARVREELSSVKVDDSLLRYVSLLLAKLRGHAALQRGASVRGGLAVVRCARVLAAVEGRNYVIPDDIRQFCAPALAHRIVLSAEARVAGVVEDTFIEDLVKQVEFPK